MDINVLYNPIQCMKMEMLQYNGYRRCYNKQRTLKLQSVHFNYLATCALANLGTSGAMPSKHPTIVFLLQETYFRTNWPTPQVAQMQGKLSTTGGFAPWRGALPQTSLGICPVPNPHYRFAASRSLCAPNSSSGSASAHVQTVVGIPEKRRHRKHDQEALLRR